MGASFAFAGIYFFTPLYAPASAESLWAIRTIITLPLLALLLVWGKRLHTSNEIASRIRARPAFLLPLFVSGALLAAQLWLFSWAPLHGRGLEVALGYFLLPLVLVIVGRILYRDQLRWWHWFAAGVAAVGVSVEVVRVGGFSWETMLVALGYPAYFVLRRSLGIAHLGGMLWELLVMLPFAAILLVVELTVSTSFAQNSALWWIGPALAVVSGAALILYVTASKLLSLSIFGLLSYVEPALLMVASLLNGERIEPTEWIMYICIWAAVLVLLVGGIVTLVRSHDPPTG